jgi:DNA-binding PadR family transcriptional regulator
VSGRIDGLTKLAKLDFFARYPEFFEAARAAVAPIELREVSTQDAPEDAVEAAMVRHRYGPWDKRYYQVLAHLESKKLITVTKEKNSYRIALTDLGRERARALANRASFAPLVERMRAVKKTFGAKSGSSLKALIYRLFDEEVARRPLGQLIRK